jgi:hypothetical protein
MELSANTERNALYDQQRLAYEIDRYRRGKG